MFLAPLMLSARKLSPLSIPRYITGGNNHGFPCPIERKVAEEACLFSIGQCQISTLQCREGKSGRTRNYLIISTALFPKPEYYRETLEVYKKANPVCQIL
jgi:hypothetical protein